MKTNNVASYTDVLVTCMRQNPKWILLSEVRSAEAVTAVRNSISSGHNILSTIHADKASAIPYRLYSLLETDIDVNQFLNTIYRYVQIGVHIKAYYSKEYGKFHREVDEVVEFYVDNDNNPISHTIYRKLYVMDPIMTRPSEHLIEYLENQNIDVNSITGHLSTEDVEDIIAENEKQKHELENNQANPINDTNVNNTNDVINSIDGNIQNSNSVNNEVNLVNVSPINETNTINSSTFNTTIDHSYNSMSINSNPINPINGGGVM